MFMDLARLLRTLADAAKVLASGSSCIGDVAAEFQGAGAARRAAVFEGGGGGLSFDDEMKETPAAAAMTSTSPGALNTGT